ncbi:MAG TPA: oxygenase MpaB family protein, partial [Solirubrobacteraceae bacterium]|nr:oxygenase MpaB family protein [Solirubrobacteraceae bacterium]
MDAESRFTPIPFRAAAPGEGYFDDDALIRRVHRELIVAFSGARALLLQAAHPVMFEGFYDRTSGLADPHGRLARTATVMNTIYFGRRDDADALTARVRRGHPRKARGGAAPGRARAGPRGRPRLDLVARLPRPHRGAVGGVVLHQPVLLRGLHLDPDP